MNNNVQRSGELQLFSFPKLRRGNGQFCTEEQYKIDRVKDENVRLRFEKEKYFRMAMALEKDNERLTRELAALKEKIRGLM